MLITYDIKILAFNNATEGVQMILIYYEMYTINIFYFSITSLSQRYLS